MPFCCCQARAAVHAVTRGVSTQPAPSCCTQCCHAEEATEGGNAPCSDPGSKDTRTGCCTSCKDRVLPAAITLDTPDSFGTDLIFAAMEFSVLPDVPTNLFASAQREHTTGPPGKASGRDLLQYACILLV